MSGSRSTWGAGGGGPIHGASAWPSSFTGPARYAPPFDTDAAEENPSDRGETYSPYAETGSGYTDPYADDAYAAGLYGTETYGADAYGAETYVGEQPQQYGAYATDAYRAHPYGYAEADYAAPEFASSAYFDGDYPAHDFQSFSSRSFSDTDTAEVAVTRLTEPAGPGELTGLDIPGPREPESPRTRSMPRRPAPRRVGWAGRVVQGAVLTALLGGVTAYVAFEKTINISVDGSTRKIHSFATTVGAALASDDITTGSHDLVSPAADTTLTDNSTITVKYGRPVNVTVDGKPKHAWVHAVTVSTALQELGVRTQGARFVSATADTPIGRSGADFTVFTLRHITFLVDGKTDRLNTTDATVQQALADAGITLHNQDTASVPLSSLPTDGQTISIMRITGTTEVKQVSIPYSVTKQNDPNSYVGSTTVVTPGQKGVAQVTYALQIINGVKQPPKEISRVVVKQPVTEVEKVGTKALPTDVSSLNWAALAQCESGGNPRAVDPSGSYYGLYQFSVSTWQSLGGSGLPSNASASEQTTRAELLYQRSGAGQWPVCGHNLFS